MRVFVYLINSVNTCSRVLICRVRVRHLINLSCAYVRMRAHLFKLLLAHMRAFN